MLFTDKKDKFFNFMIYFLLVLFALTIIIPLLYVLANSLSNYIDVYNGNVFLIPRHIDFEVYKIVLSNDYILKGYRNTIIYTILGTIISLVLTFSAAYPLSRKDFKYKKAIMIIFLFTMFFQGGMIPTYIIVDSIGIKDTIWGFILPGALSVWNVIVTKTYLQSSIPFEMYEAAKIDGANDFKILIRIVLPLCKSIVAIMALFYAVGYWNSYFNSLLYLNDSNLFPLQRILSDIIIASDTSSMTGASGSLKDQGKMVESIKYVTIVISSAPILLLYPFVAKYFEKGVMIGSIKE
ncbi:MAG: carbohydrate ABC transporter permease [Candidatus Caccosoma sp.]|nr:carbohydrate ABC transporter permease [Candidatus Caccosoma sp.]